MLNDEIKKINKKNQMIKNRSGAFGFGSLDSCLIFLFYFCLRSTLLGFFLKFFHQKHSLLLNLFLAGNDLEFDHHCGGREIGYIGIFCLKMYFFKLFSPNNIIKTFINHSLFLKHLKINKLLTIPNLIHFLMHVFFIKKI